MLVKDFVRVLTEEYGCYFVGMEGDTRLYAHRDLEQPLRIKGKDRDYVGKLAQRKAERLLHIVY